MGKRQSSVFALAAVLGLVACGGGDAPEPAETTVDVAPPPPPTVAVELPEGVTQDMVARGQAIFTTQTCFTCHGMDGGGSPLAPSLRDDEWINTVGTYEGIIDVIKLGVASPVSAPAPMPAMGGAQLTDEQVREVAAYVYTLSRGG